MNVLYWNKHQIDNKNFHVQNSREFMQKMQQVYVYIYLNSVFLTKLLKGIYL